MSLILLYTPNSSYVIWNNYFVQTNLVTVFKVQYNFYPCTFKCKWLPKYAPFNANYNFICADSPYIPYIIIKPASNAILVLHHVCILLWKRKLTKYSTLKTNGNPKTIIKKITSKQSLYKRTGFMMLPTRYKSVYKGQLSIVYLLIRSDAGQY